MAYNPLGLIVSQAGTGAEITTTRTFTYDVSGHRLTADGRDGDSNYTWNGEGELVFQGMAGRHDR